MSNDATLSALSDSLADAVEAASLAVVRVVCGRRVGSGLAWSEQGHVLCAASTLARAGAPTVRLHDGAEHPAQVVGVDPALDLALLKVDAELQPLPTTDGGELRVGAIVLVLGRPGRTIRASLGLVSSSSGEPWTTPLGSVVDRFVDVDASLRPGFEGGPLLDAKGRVVGLNTRGLVRGGTTIPTVTLARAADELATHGTKARGWLGVRFEVVSLDDEDQALTGAARGLLVRKAAPDSPATDGGVKLGDVLLSLGDKPLGSWRELAQALCGTADTETPLRVLRGGAVHELAVTPRERPLGLRC